MKMNHIRNILIGVGGALGLVICTIPASAQNSGNETQRLIVETKQPDMLSIDDAEVVIKKKENRNALLVVDVPADQSVASFKDELKKEAGVVRVEQDHLVYKTQTPNDPDFSTQFHHRNIETEKAWTRTMGARSVIVAVIDDGIDQNHRDLRGNIVDGYDIVNNSPYTITNGDHGTHVAGIISGVSNNGLGGTGVAPTTTVMPLDVFTGDSAYSSDVIKAIYRATDRGASIINMSLGSYYYNSLYQSAINYAHDKGVVVIAAAGNDATSRKHYPSSYNHVVSVASTTSWDDASYFSNYGEDIDIAAPGSSIYSTLPYDDYGYMSGTSMASPVVAGVAALIKADDFSMTNDQIVSRLEETADDLGTNGWDYEFGHGRVNAANALLIKEYGQLYIDEVTDQSTTIDGEVPFDIENGTIYVYDLLDELVGKQVNVSQGRFSIPIDKQPSNRALSIFIEDEKDNKSARQPLIVTDRTKPGAPVVNELTDQQTQLTGTGEIDGIVQVHDEKGNLINDGTVDIDGMFDVYISQQLSGTRLFVTITDTSGNISEQTVVQVMDRTKPVFYEIDPITDQMNRVTGDTEPGATITIKHNNTMIGVGKSDQANTFAVSIPRQKAGTKLSLIVTDAAGNDSEVAFVQVLDRTAPAKAKVETFSDNMTTLNGTAEKNSTVEIKRDNKVIAKQSTTSGKFSIRLPKQKAGTVLSVFVYDEAKNRSTHTLVAVLDRTPPVPPTVNVVTTKTTVLSGKVEANSIVEVYSGKTKVKSTTASSKGTYKLTIKPMKKNTKLTLYAMDKSKNKSNARFITVKSYSIDK
ncbi:Ig-like domain-containing protein [Exiguobacterium sp. 22311]|uniref:S8 family peptidase n=1 Tax=Exiguobacterium sp. 22311 TaxID=3453907 RepID=UPI003F831D9F